MRCTPRFGVLVGGRIRDQIVMRLFVMGVMTCLEGRHAQNRRLLVLNPLGEPAHTTTQKGNSKETDTHGFEPATEPTRRQVLNACEEIITHEVAKYHRGELLINEKANRLTGNLPESHRSDNLIRLLEERSCYSKFGNTK